MTLELRAGNHLKNDFKDKFEDGADIGILYDNFIHLIVCNTQIVSSVSLMILKRETFISTRPHHFLFVYLNFYMCSIVLVTNKYGFQYLKNRLNGAYFIQCLNWGIKKSYWIDIL